MNAKRNVTVAAVGVCLGALLIVSQTAGSNRGHQPFKLGGAWIMKFQGNPTTCMVTDAPDASGRRAAVSGTTVIGDPTLGGAFLEAQWQSPVMGEAVVTGWDRGAFTVVQYGLKPGAAGLPEIVYIIVDSGTFKEIGPGKTEHQHNAAVYLPFQDADGDGLPDEGQAPVACVPMTSLETRVSLLPPCTP